MQIMLDKNQANLFDNFTDQWEANGYGQNLDTILEKFIKKWLLNYKLYNSKLTRVVFVCNDSTNQ